VATGAAPEGELLDALVAARVDDIEKGIWRISEIMSRIWTVRVAVGESVVESKEQVSGRALISRRVQIGKPRGRC
jgi:hypothetical protein